jgi:N-acetylmuramoyl-L-alanine amidase
VPKQHRVKQGDSLYTIAKEEGFLNWRSIYDAPENESLRVLRPNPQVLLPGDVVVIPDVELPGTPLSLDKRTIMARRKRGVQPLRIVLRREDGAPLAGQEYQLTFDGGNVRGKTDAKGLLREEIPVGVINVQLKAGIHSRTLVVGFLDPLDDTPGQEITGVQERLRNLGYYNGPIDGATNGDLAQGLTQFQSDQRLPETGEADQETQEKLLEVHGS